MTWQGETNRQLLAGELEAVHRPHRVLRIRAALELDERVPLALVRVWITRQVDELDLSERAEELLQISILLDVLQRSFETGDVQACEGDYSVLLIWRRDPLENSALPTQRQLG